MAMPRHLAHAPIVEAIIDIRVQPRDGLSFRDLERAFTSLDFGYYVKGPISQGLFSIQLPADGQTPETTASAAAIGVRLHSKDEKYVLQCRLSGFTLSRLSPYEDWKVLVNETKRLWDIYRDALRPICINRIAARFINDLQLPMEPGTSFQKYLVKLVDIPEGVPQTVRSFVQRFELADYHAQASVILTVALEPEYQPSSRVPVVLDIDAFKTANMDPGSPDLWESLERLRAAKNRVFFSVLNEEALELYQ